MPIAEVRYVITNGGADVRGHGEADYYPAGQHDGAKIHPEQGETGVTARGEHLGDRPTAAPSVVILQGLGRVGQ